MPAKQKPFFVGYLPMPPALLRFYLPLSLLLIVAAAAAGYFTAAAQKHAGHAHWETAAPITVHGVLTTSPYPLLHIPHATRAGETESIMLVGRGKHAAAVPARLNGVAVTVRGYEIQRGDWRMLELPAGRNIVTRLAAGHNIIYRNLAAISDGLDFTALGDIRISGEIADSKCFLGVMKPGAGRVHKACAEVCLRGGIPPMLLAKNKRGQKFGYLLMRDDFKSAAVELAKHAADSVYIDGQLMRRGDLLFIKINPDGVQKL